MFKRRVYAFTHSERIYRHACKGYRYCADGWPGDVKAAIQKHLSALRGALSGRDRRKASDEAKALEGLMRDHYHKSWLRAGIELVVALTIAITFALIVRQMWFELYEIPTGSMRPTFRERDRLIVTKTTFGMNLPLSDNHLFFDETRVKRGGVVIWSGENIDLPETDTNFLGIIPYKKRYIKRLVGKPGDSLYFYGGQLWGLDANGNDLAQLREDPWMQPLEYIPFSTFEGRALAEESTRTMIAVFRHFNLPTARLRMTGSGQGNAEVYRSGRWKPESADAAYTDLFGIGNYAMARLLTPKQLDRLSQDAREGIADGILYLQLGHHPRLNSPAPRFAQYSDGSIRPLLTPQTSIIPLNEAHLSALMQNMYTVRFVVKDGRASRYDVGGHRNRPDNPLFPELTDGSYELYNGIAYKVGFGGHLSQLPESHPLYAKTPENVQRLFNLGIEFRDSFDPASGRDDLYPSRFAYYRDGDLYAMGTKVMDGEDPMLQQFVQHEQRRAAAGHTPFVDAGRPTAETIQQYGVQIPEKHYMVLGDNHALSADSRSFGFVPEGNIEGSPSIIIWPLQDRWGPPPQAYYPWYSPARVIVWIVALLAALIYREFRKRRPLPALPF